MDDAIDPIGIELPLGSTINHVGGNQVNNNIVYVVQASSNSRPAPARFIEAPLDVLSAHFTGRGKELLRIHELLDSVDGDVPARCVIHGMHAIGKSQLTLSFAKSAFEQERYKYVLWISATSVEKLQQGMTKLLDLLNHNDRRHPQQDIRLMAVRQWLEECEANWLLILDNVEPDTLDFLRNHLPRRNQRGNILFTTRSESLAETLASAAGIRHHVLELQIPSVPDATILLLNHLEGDVDDDIRNKAADIVKSVGCLPLAVAQAGSFIQQSGKSLNDVLTLYRSDRKVEMINWENALSSYEAKSVAATFMSQFEDLSLKHPTASDLLNVLAFLDPESISVDMLAQDPQVSKPSLFCRMKRMLPFSKTIDIKPLVSLLQSPVELQNALTQLYNRSLVKYQRSTEDPTLIIHDLVYFMLRHRVEKTPVKGKWFDFTVRLVSGAFSQVEDPTLPQNWPHCETYISHLRSLTTQEETFNGSKAWHILTDDNHRIARYLYSCGRYDESERLFKRVLAWKDKRNGSRHPSTLQTLHSLAFVCHKRGRYQEAETLYQRVLAGQSKVLGRHDLVTLITLGNLAAAYEAQGRYNEAEELHKEVLVHREKRLGKENHRTLFSMNSLAAVYRSQGRFAEAEAMHTQVLAGRRKLLGPDNPFTLLTMDHLAVVYTARGRYEDAEKMHKEVLAIRERLLGNEHPDTLTSMDHLGMVYMMQGHYDEAETIHKCVLKTQEKHLGVEHPHTLLSLAHLASVYNCWSRFKDAETIHAEIQTNWENVFGVKHPETFRYMSNVALTHEFRDRHDDAEAILAWILPAQKELLGPEHPDTLTSMDLLARVYISRGRHVEAEEMYEKVFTGRKQCFGDDHPLTTESMHHLERSKLIV